VPREIDASRLDLAEFVQPGDTVGWSHATAEPLTLTENLVARRHAIGRFRAYLGTAFSRTLRPEHADAIELFGTSAVGFNREFVKAGVLDVVPCHLSEIPRLVERGMLRVDVMLLQLAEHEGRFSFGAVSQYIGALARHARVVIAEVNARAPFTLSQAGIDPGRIDAVVHTDRALLEVPPQAPTPADAELARHIVPLIPDGAVLQVGIGTLPNAVLAGLAQHRDLGIHSGVIGDNVLTDLIDRGVVTNATKPFDRGISVTSGLFGTARLYAFADRNSALRVEPVEYTNDIARIARFDAFVTVNSALEVD
jgi:acetyl-CoA hydrolase